jgi:hypothetical protein
MKNYIFILGLVAFLTNSCKKDFLEKASPNNLTTGNYYTKPEHALQAINAAYSALQRRV